MRTSPIPNVIVGNTSSGDLERKAWQERNNKDSQRAAQILDLILVCQQIPGDTGAGSVTALVKFKVKFDIVQTSIWPFQSSIQFKAQGGAMNFMVIFERTLDLDSLKSSNISLVACGSLIDLVCRTRGGGACDPRRRTPPPPAACSDRPKRNKKIFSAQGWRGRGGVARATDAADILIFSPHPCPAGRRPASHACYSI